MRRKQPSTREDDPHRGQEHGGYPRGESGSAQDQRPYHDGNGNGNGSALVDDPMKAMPRSQSPTVTSARRARHVALRHLLRAAEDKHRIAERRLRPGGHRPGTLDEGADFDLIRLQRTLRQERESGDREATRQKGLLPLGRPSPETGRASSSSSHGQGTRAGSQSPQLLRHSMSAEAGSWGTKWGVRGQPDSPALLRGASHDGEWQEVTEEAFGPRGQFGDAVLAAGATGFGPGQRTGQLAAG